MRCVQVGWGGGVGKWGDECSVNGGDGERLLFSNVIFAPAVVRIISQVNTYSLNVPLSMERNSFENL